MHNQAGLVSLTIKDDASFKRDDLLKFYQEEISVTGYFAGNIKKQPAYQKANMIVGSDLTNSDTIKNTFFWCLSRT